MTIKEANNKLEKINNDIDYWIDEKIIATSNVEPKAVDTTKEAVTSGNRTDRYANYVIVVEPIDRELDRLYAIKKNLETYIEKELHRLGKYRKVEQLIIYYKEQCLEDYTWEEIGRKVYMNKDNCRKIYRKWKGKRNVDE